MFGLRRGLGTRIGREASRLLAQIPPDRGSGGPDRLAQRLRRHVSVALSDRNGVSVNDDVRRLVLLGALERAGGCLRIGAHVSAVEILAPAVVGLEHDDAVGEPVGGDDIGHCGTRETRASRASIGDALAYLTATIYTFLCIPD